ncbi:MAG: 50S ribosomal protein L21 [Thaumarchaeota archaeon]|nr:50S ribosomal protein L21 [Nitrososphaerota archaeon]
MPRSHGYRRKTRSLLTSRSTGRGLTPFLRQYKANDKVVIDIDPTQVKGMPHRRFQGLIGIIEEVGRRSLVINVKVGGKTKKVIARLEHVKPQTGVKSQ